MEYPLGIIREGQQMKIMIYILLVLLIAGLCSAQRITLRWNANSESDLAGYKLYYRTAGFTYSDPTPIEDEVPIYGASPIVLVINCDPLDNDCINNSDPLFTLEMDLTDKDYWMVLTAYDNEAPENESGFSNEVTTEEDINSPPNTSGGESNGGCFINSMVAGTYNNNNNDKKGGKK